MVSANNDGTGVGWRTLARYARAAHEFSATPAVSLSSSCFERIAAADLAALPPVQMFRMSDGADIAYRHYQVNGKPRVAVILLHGSAGHAGQLHGVAQAIVAANSAEVYSLDMRGHGASPGRRGHEVRHEDQLHTDICEFVGFVDRSAPSLPIVIGGHSAGGGLVLRFCRSPAGQRVAGCLLLAPYLGLGSATVRPLFGGWVSLHVNRMQVLTFLNLLEISRFNETTVTRFNLGILADDPNYTPNWSFNTTMAFSPGLWWDEVPPIDRSIAVLSVCGDRDDCFFPEAYPPAFVIVAPHAELKMVAGCGHWDILVDSQVSNAVTEWLDRCVPG